MMTELEEYIEQLQTAYQATKRQTLNMELDLFTLTGEWTSDEIKAMRLKHETLRDTLQDTFRMREVARQFNIADRPVAEIQMLYRLQAD